MKLTRDDGLFEKPNTVAMLTRIHVKTLRADRIRRLAVVVTVM